MREELVTGMRDPKPEELVKLEEYKLPQKAKEKPEIDFEELKATKGLPGFWLKAMKNDHEITSQIEPTDEPILKHLTNIKQEILEGPVYILNEIINRIIASSSHSHLTSISRTPN